jgi:recombination protein RecT
MSNNQLVEKPVEKLKKVLKTDSVQEQFDNALKENSGNFVASLIDLYGSDNYLQKCDPSAVVMEALRAATLKLPINKQLGFAYIVPFKKKGKPTPQFILGYKGYIQLAMRTGQYRFLNADVVREGVDMKKNLLTGEIVFEGEPESAKSEVKGYFAYLELLNGFSKSFYMTKKDVQAYGEEYSPSYKSSYSPWTTNFDKMALKTTIRQLLSVYGYLSTEMMSALTNDTDFNDESGIQEEVENEANSEIIDIEKENEPEPAKEDKPEKSKKAPF